MKKYIIWLWRFKANVKVLGNKYGVWIGIDSLDYFNPKTFLQFIKESAHAQANCLNKIY